MGIPYLAIAIPFAVLLGFSAHRASICTDRATAEVLSTGRARMFWSFGKTVIWVFVFNLAAILLFPRAELPADAWSASAMAVMGGQLFGIGSALNGGCAFSTLGHLCDGNLKMILTLVGFAAGAAMSAVLEADALISLPARSTVFVSPSGWTAILVLGLGLGWGAWELHRLWRTRPKELRLWERIRVRRYRLSMAAFLIGLSNAFLYSLYGSWTYTGVIGDWGRALAGFGITPAATLWVLLLAVLAGMLVSSWERGQFFVEWRPKPVWAMNLCGGLLMGFGAAIAPGGNDVLILHQIPIFSPHALIAYVSIVVGIALVLLLMRAISGKEMIVRCSDDVCTDQRKVI